MGLEPNGREAKDFPTTPKKRKLIALGTINAATLLLLGKKLVKMFIKSKKQKQ